MSVLIKAAAGSGSVRAYMTAPQPLPSQPIPTVATRPAEDPRLNLLRQENAELRRALAELREAAPLAEAAAREEGRRAGAREAQRDDEGRIELLRSGLDAAAASWTDRLDGMDALAALLARSALAKLFDRSEDLADLVIRMIARQVATMRRGAVVAIRVSPQDFPDEAKLAAIPAAASTGAVAISADPELGAGDCRLDLQLGHVDLGVTRQWAELAQILDGLADAEAGA